jgi:DNA-binding response OmpR family regulator
VKLHVFFIIFVKANSYLYHKRGKTMKPIFSTLIVKDLEGKSYTKEIQDKRILVGRLSGENDIVLFPDPQQLVTRYMHCSIEQRNGRYWIIDNASKNGTFLKRNNAITRIRGEEPLENNDTILILGLIDEKNNPKYWQLEFKDPTATESAPISQNQQRIEYDWVKAKLFINNGSSVQEIKDLSPLEHKLIRFMDQQNKNNGNVTVMCTYEEIINAVWDESANTRTMNDVNHLVAGLRKKIEKDIKNPRFLVNMRGMGYSFITNLFL